MSIPSRVAFVSEYALLSILNVTGRASWKKFSSLRAKPRFEMSNETAVDDADSSIESKERADITEILTEGFMQSFVPSMDSLQGRLGELT